MEILLGQRSNQNSNELDYKKPLGATHSQPIIGSPKLTEQFSDGSYENKAIDENRM